MPDNDFKFEKAGPQPNDSTSQPNESDKPVWRLPDETKGQIAEVCKDPAIAEKRRLNHRAAMRGNTFALRHGRYSKQPALIGYLRFLDELELHDVHEVRDAIKKIALSHLKYLAVAEYEDLQQGTPGSSETIRLAKDTFTMMSYLHQNPQILEKKPEKGLDLTGLTKEQVDILFELLTTISQLHPVDKLWLAHALKKELESAGEKAAQNEQLSYLPIGEIKGGHQQDIHLSVPEQCGVATMAGLVELE